jgi:hypothetical protein
MDDLAVGNLTQDDVFQTSYKLLEECTGRRWWQAARILLTGEAPDFLGRATLAGMDPWNLTVGQWCSGLYALLTQNLDEPGRFKVDAQLSMPPAGVDDDDWADDDFDQMVASARNMPGMG